MMEDSPDLMIDPSVCWKAATGILDGFAWRETKEGYAYWQTIHNRLIELARKNPNPIQHAPPKNIDKLPNFGA